MAKTAKNDFDLDLDADSTQMTEVPANTSTMPITSIDLGDYSEFEAGIEKITFSSEDKVNALIYGPTGTGKTTLAGTFPKPVLVLDVNERGTRVLASDEEGMSKRYVDTFEMFVQAYWYLRAGKHPFKTVVIDNVTTLQQAGLKYIMNKEEAFDLSKDKDMPNKRDWGGLAQIMKTWLINFRNLPGINVVFIAQEKRDKDEDLENDECSVYPQVTPAVKSILCAAVDVVGRTYVSESTKEGKTTSKFCIRVAPGPKYEAKIRIPTGAETPRSLSNPSYDKLKFIMDGKYKSNTKEENKDATI